MLIKMEAETESNVTAFDISFENSLQIRTAGKNKVTFNQRKGQLYYYKNTFGINIYEYAYTDINGLSNELKIYYLL